jgi:hypothetical protein
VPSYEDNLIEGDAFAAFVATQLAVFGLEVGLYRTQHEQYDVGESRMGLEIKFDRQLASTHNVYIEREEKTRASNRAFVPAGIERGDNTLLYGIGNRQEFYIFGKRTLQRVYEAFTRPKFREYLPPGRDFQLRATPTSRGFTLARGLAASWAERIFKAKPDGTWYDAQAVAWSFRVDDLRRALERDPR